MIKNYDQEIEKMYHPENFETVEECPSCKEEDFRPVLIGNDKDGWNKTGEWQCGSCDYQDVEPHDCKSGEESGCDCNKLRANL
ncbi:MAG: hypothetical protein ISR98_02150 [Parcubacteria group bacterium]|nr:hypothetical protein [Parcubacteria group bacterium]